MRNCTSMIAAAFALVVAGSNSALAAKCRTDIDMTVTFKINNSPTAESSYWTLVPDNTKPCEIEFLIVKGAVPPACKMGSNVEAWGEAQDIGTITFFAEKVRCY